MARRGGYLVLTPHRDGDGAQNATSEQPGGKKQRLPFARRGAGSMAWGGSRLETARQWIDVWAALERSPGADVPTTERVLDDAQRTVRVIGTSYRSMNVRGPDGKKLLDVDGKPIVVRTAVETPVTDPRTGMPIEIDPVKAATSAPYADSRMRHMSVELVVASSGNLYREILLRLYPRLGPFCELDYDALPVDERERELVVLGRIKPGFDLAGRHVATEWQRLLSTMHREIVRKISIVVSASKPAYDIAARDAQHMARRLGRPVPIVMRADGAYWAGIRDLEPGEQVVATAYPNARQPNLV